MRSKILFDAAHIQLINDLKNETLTEDEFEKREKDMWNLLPVNYEIYPAMLSELKKKKFPQLVEKQGKEFEKLLKGGMV